MSKSKTLEVKVERAIPAPPAEVFDAWLNPKVPGTPWSEGEKVILDPKAGKLWHWRVQGTPHYGLFMKVDRPHRIQHTWMSFYTNGLESKVTVTFKKKGADTLMTLSHSGLPNDKNGKAHEDGWNHFLNHFPKHFGKGKKK